VAGELDWARDGADWPNREFSRFIDTPTARWHVQVAGSGPAVLLIHGTGASTHSWRDVLPLLAGHATVIAPDLPGHAFTEARSGGAFALNGMAQGLAELIDALAARPVLAVGHSAGAAIGARFCLDRREKPHALVSFNGAFIPPPGIAGVPGSILSPLARTLADMPIVPQLVAWRAGDPFVMSRLLHYTGSRVDARGLALYTRLGQSAAHVRGTLLMMSNWDLAPLVRDLPGLASKLALVVGSSDGTVPPAQSERIGRMVAGSELIRWDKLGHLAHEERPDLAAAEICRWLE
jgi:magnesium chelatase accessory protein